MLGVGATFAGYRVEGVLGQGGMGTVYLARHPRLPRSVALKLLNREVSTDTELTRRFELEADVVARLEHPGIVGVFDRGTDEGHLWIAMQYVRGTDAATWVARAHPPATAVRLLGETAAALDYAHGRGVLHRDVKPANILIADADPLREAHSVLTDFGIARLTDANTKMTATGAFTATLAYGSPEQLSGEVVDQRTDQYSLGCTLFAVLAGRPPYASTNPGQVVMGHISQPVPRLTATRPDLPAAIDGVLARAMAKHRDDRFGSCAEFTTAIRDALDGRHTAAPVAAPISAPAAQPRIPPEHGPREWPGRGSWTPPIPARARVATDPRRAASGPAWAAPVAGPGPVAGAGGPKPSRGTAVTAAIATLLVACFPAFIWCVGLVETVRMAGAAGREDLLYSIIALLVVSAVLLLWAGSAVLLLAGRRIGRALTLVSSVLGVITSTIGEGAVIYARELAGLAAITPLLILSVIALICAAARSTGRWIDHRTAVRAVRRRY
ncbi:protein kinase domain-containing protein [Nocardia sp. NBC_00416]|uniref:protein kinase domain-containing protein n=1 Tax=Nocardia sp. NBC_00416 TaxID=2975991 RepID=UPI002E238F4B